MRSEEDWKQVGNEYPVFSVSGDFGEGKDMCTLHEIKIMAQMIWLARHEIKQIPECKSVLTDLQAFVKAYPEAKSPKDLRPMEKQIKTIVSTFNTSRRLKIRDTSSWPRSELARVAGQCPPFGVPPPPTPCDYVSEEFGWSGFGQFARKKDWIGHGLWWRGLPSDVKKGCLENAAGNAMNDYDTLEHRFTKLKKAKVLGADYALLRQDFPELYPKTNKEIDQWLVDNCAYLSEGQVKRLEPGGDHADRLGIKDIDDYIDKSDKTTAIRQRSGGRAATFFAGKKYWFMKNRMVGNMIDVKGIGTHILADISHPKVSGLLNMADALRECMFQRLIQRLIELEGQESVVNTVKFYGIIDTGLEYVGTNPATGWKNERCVLSLRQRNSRLFDCYDGFNFSGVCPTHVLKHGPGRELRRILIKYGVSAEFFPQALLYNSKTSDGISVARNASSGVLDDLSGTWNLQSDATGKNFLDFTDFYVLPNAPGILNNAWKLTEKALCDSFCLERKAFVDIAMQSPPLMSRVFGNNVDKKEAYKFYEKRLAALSEDPKIIEAAHTFDSETKLVRPNKPKYCMCWFMELDDSGMSQWCLATAKAYAENPNIIPDIFGYIDSKLPVEALPDAPLEKFPARGSEHLPSWLSDPVLPNTAQTPATDVYHRDWRPTMKQPCPYGTKVVTLDPTDLGRSIYKLLISCIVPRPIALVSSISSTGSVNLAPYSYFGAMNHSPATICFSPCRNRGEHPDKDTLRNIKETKEFVVHIMSKWFVDVANHTCGNFLYGDNEFKIAGATQIPSVKVKAPRVQEAAIQLECKLSGFHEIKDTDGVTKATMVIGEIILFHINEGVYDEDSMSVNASKLMPISRMGGNTYGQTCGMFDLPRPDRNKK